MIEAAPAEAILRKHSVERVANHGENRRISPMLRNPALSYPMPGGHDGIASGGDDTRPGVLADVDEDRLQRLPKK